MRAAPLVSGMFLVALASPVLAQTPECSAYVSNAQRVCAAAVDGTRAFHPLMGVLVSGGNPVIGSAAPLGGLGHASLTLRANAVEVVFPDLSYNGGASSVPAGDKLWAPAPQFEGALGVFGGVGNGLLAIDLLGSAQLLPADQIDNLSVDPNATKVGGVALGLGYGARVGLLRGSGPLPAVSVSVMQRNIPQITYGNVPAGDRFSYGLDLHATNLRLVASKQIVFLELAAGLGWDKYTGDATIQFRDPITNAAQPEIPVELNSSRVLGFLNAGMNLSVVRLTGEIGYLGGKDENLSSDFDDFDTTKGNLFAGFGLRVGF